MLVGRAQPLPDLIHMLHLTDCAAPCWLNIQPGKTPMQEAYRRLSQSYDLPEFQDISTDFVPQPADTGFPQPDGRLRRPAERAAALGRAVGNALCAV